MKRSLGSIFYVLFLIFSLGYVKAQEVENNIIRIKVTESLASKIEAAPLFYDAEGNVITGDAHLNDTNLLLKAKLMKRVFPHAGKFEARHRASGLHLWYEIQFSPAKEHIVNNIILEYKNLDEVYIAEPVYKKLVEAGVAALPEPEVLSGPLKNPMPTSVNDPRFNEQWHYDNTGQSEGTAGADIDLPEAWDVATGSNQVLVAIIDQGIEVTHEDLAENIWTNTAELNGIDGVDDDNNGFVDDVYGYNFAMGQGEIVAGNHGTHVAGTVGAVSNNGIGIAGVAGGSGAGDGVKMMSCQVFSSSGNGGFGNALVYAADNGAVIAQNSWGYTYAGVFEQSTLDGIDYFVENAGYDENGVPFGPLQGGLVVFASGNSNSNAEYYPGVYEPVMSVASTTHDDTRSYFSNYGPKVDIAAPGGETIIKSERGVLSSLNGNSYGFYQGTSMAAPHVSGVAALVIGHYANDGLTNRDIWDKLIYSTDNIDALNPSFVGDLGRGRLNAHGALTIGDDVTAPNTILDLSIASVMGNTLTLEWTNPGDDREIEKFVIRQSSSPITEANFDSATLLEEMSPGENETNLALEVTGLSYQTQYYFAIKSLDRAGNVSDLSNVVDYTVPGAPNVEYSITDYAVTLGAFGEDNSSFDLDNTGLSELYVEVSDVFISATPSGNGKDNVYGYEWKDSEEVDGPEFIWYDIKEIGTELSLTDDDYEKVTLPFDFKYFGESKSEIFVTSNGILTFHNAKATDYSGDIPSESGPNDVVAGLWYDLNPSFGGTVYHYSTATEFIVQYEGVVDWSLRLPFTFQIILNQNGDITAHYKEVNGVSRSPLGIENSDGTVGLQSTAPLGTISDGYSVKMIAPKLFIYNLSTALDVIDPNETSAVTYAIKSINLDPGVYVNNIVIESTDPDEPSIDIPVTLTVEAEPILSLSMELLEMPATFVGFSKKDSIKVFNSGNADLLIGDITSDQLQIVPTMNNTTVAPGSFAYLVVEFTPTESSFLSSAIQINSNDASNPVKELTVNAEGVVLPVLDESITALKFRVELGEQKNVDFKVGNLSDGKLEYTISEEPLYSEGASDGYYYTSSNTAGSVVYDWIDISTTGAQLTIDDDDFTSISLPFSFEFYGTSYNNLHVGDNGIIGFSTLGMERGDNQSLPNNIAPNNLIAAYWTDFDPDSGGAIYEWSDQEKMIIQYENIQFFGLAQANTFQVILYKDGGIKIQYKSVFDNGFKTVGIEGPLGEKSLMIVYNDSKEMANEEAYYIAPHNEILTINTPLDGTIDGVGENTHQLVLNPNDAPAGEYTAYLKVRSNDPDYEGIDNGFVVPITVQVCWFDNNLEPQLTTIFEDVTIELDEFGYEINLQAHFTDPEDNAMEYTVTIGDASIISAALDHAILTVNPLQLGSTNIAIEVKDNGCKSVATEFTLTVDEITALGANEDQNIQVYPVPSNGRVEIAWGQNLTNKKGRLEVVDLKGQLVHSESVYFSGGNGIVTKDFAHLHSGIYFLTVQGENEILHRQKIVISKK